MEKFKKNLLFAFIAQGTSTSLSILISLILPKMLGVQEFAYWQLFIFYSGYVGFFHFGLSDGLYLKYGGTNLDDMNKPLIGSQFRFMVAWQILISIIALMIIPFFINDSERLFVWILTAIYLVVANATWCLGYVFQAANETKIYSVGMIISKALFLVVMIVSVLMKRYDFKLYVVFYVGAQTVAMIYSVVRGWNFVSAKWAPLRETIHEIIDNISIGINLTFSNTASSLILGFGRGFVDSHWNISAFGVFSLAISLMNFILQFITQISMVMFPALRQTSSDTRNDIYKILRDSIGIILCGVLIFYVPMRMILTWWLPQYSESLRYLGIILPICVFDGKMQMLYNTYMKVLRKEKNLLFINLFSCILSLVMCFILTAINEIVLMAVFAIIITIAARSIIASIYLSKMMHLEQEKTLFVEIILVLIFIMTNYYFTPIAAFLIYVAMYAGVIFITHHQLWSIIKLIKRKEIN